MNAEESKNRFISSSEAKEKCRSAYSKLLESAREGNMVCIRRGVYAKIEQLADTKIDLDVVCLMVSYACFLHGISMDLPPFCPRPTMWPSKEDGRYGCSNTR